MVATDSGHPSLELLDAFARGTVDEEEASPIEDHLAICTECIAYVDRCTHGDRLLQLVREVGWSRSPTVDFSTRDSMPSGYDLIAPLGRGGMGVVYKARQRSLDRLVALKRIKAGIDANPTELARFRAEARSAASLSHPNIVKVYEVGEQDGCPFLAMELIDGGSLADRLAIDILESDEAARILEVLARAIDHAHQRGIVHRDLKPANVLIGSDGAPRIVDFGLAKFQEWTGPTLPGAILGTPRYMAPEQAIGGEIGPAVDIYALGAILYECLTGRPVFLAPGPIRLLEQIRADDPVPPGRLHASLPRDLETICLKCLEKDPRRRYLTALDLADDLGRFRRSEPIRARPTGSVERLGKWVRRRPTQAALVGVSILAGAGLLVGLFLHQLSLQAEIDRTEQAAAMARKQKARAEANYQEARATIQAILDWRRDPAFADLPRRDEVSRTQVAAALRFYDRLLDGEAAADPAVAIDLARAASEAATIEATVGRLPPALQYLRRALKLLDAASAERPNDPDAAHIRVLTKARLGLLIWQANHAADPAIAELQAAIDEADRLVKSQPGPVEYRAALAMSLHDLGVVLLGSKQFEPARVANRRAVAINRAIFQEKPGDRERRLMLAETLNNLGLLTLDSDNAASGQAFEEAVRLLDDLPAGDRNDRWVATIGSVLSNQAALDGRTGQIDRAYERFARGIEIVEQRLASQPNRDPLRNTALSLHGARASQLTAQGRFADAIADWDRVIELNKNPANLRQYRLLRLLSLVRTADHAQGSIEAEAMLRDLNNSKPEPGDGADAYNLACALALGSTAASGDDRSPAEERRQRAEELAGLAIEALRLSDRLGFLRQPRNRRNAQRDTDLNSLRNRPEWLELLDPEPPSR